MHILKIALFHILLSCRGLILGISRLLALGFLFGFTMATCFSEASAFPYSAKIGMAIVGLLFTAIYWFYDYLIFALKPEMFDLILFK